MAGSADARQTQQLAKDIRSEAEHLQQTIGGFLTGRKTLAASAAR
jgi:hypothetical protein